MPNATAEDARMGWEIYRSTDPRPTLEVINLELSARGRGSVSPRMLKHYKNLERHGYDRYMPINELDVTLKAVKFRQAS